MKRHSLQFFCLAGLLLSSISAAQAQLIDVNFTSGSNFYSGAGAIGSSGDTWNNINVPGSGNFTTSSSNDNAYNGTATSQPTSLVASDGTTTGATLTAAGFLTNTGSYGSQDNFALNLFSYGTGAFGAANSPATDTSATLTFAGLADSTAYELELYTSNLPGGGNVGRSVTFTTNDGTATALDQVSSDSFDLNQNYASVEGTTDSSGNLVITVTSASENNSDGSTPQYGFVDVMGVQAEEVSSVPEPSPWVMVLAGLVTLVGMQRFLRRT